MRKIFCFGDSVTLGERDIEGGGWATRIKKRLFSQSSNLPYQSWHLYNLGIAGETSDGLRNRFPSEFKVRSVKKQKALVVLQYGLNDVVIHKRKHRVPEAYFRRNLIDAISIAKKRSAQCVLMTMTPIDESTDGRVNQQGDLRYSADVIKFNRLIAEIGRSSDSHVFDCYAEFEQRADTLLLANDGLHPNSTGHQLIADRLFSFLNLWLA